MLSATECRHYDSSVYARNENVQQDEQMSTQKQHKHKLCSLFARFCSTYRFASTYRDLFDLFDAEKFGIHVFRF